VRLPEDMGANGARKSVGISLVIFESSKEGEESDKSRGKERQIWDIKYESSPSRHLRSLPRDAQFRRMADGGLQEQGSDCSSSDTQPLKKAKYSLTSS
jgi:hypothetical protein